MFYLYFFICLPASLSALFNPTLASAAATLTTALGLSAAAPGLLGSATAMPSAALPPPGLAIPQLGAPALALVQPGLSPATTLSQLQPALAIPPPTVVTPVLSSMGSISSNNATPVQASITSPSVNQDALRKAQEVRKR